MNNFWDERYAGQALFYGAEANRFLRDNISALPQTSPVLCLAEGEGRNAVFLAQQGLRVTGVDGSSVGLAKAQVLARERSVTIETITADLNDFELGEARWGSIVSIWCHLPTELRARLQPKIRAALIPGGVLLLEHYHPRQLEYKTGGPSDPSMMITLDELQRDFAGFEIIHSFEGECVVQEGSGHHGLSYVTQFIARKP
jgi:hypothetical protein